MYFKSEFRDNQGNPTSQWKTIKSLLGRSSSAHKHNIELNPPCVDASVKFNEHLLRNALTVNEIKGGYAKYVKDLPNFSVYLAPTNKNEVEMLHKTLGCDDISPKILKYSSSVLSAPWTHIINLSLTTGNFPDQLENAKVISSFKIR